MHLTTTPGNGRLIVPDYAFPDALCVPYWNYKMRATLEAVATAAADHLGLVLIAPDPKEASAFIARQTRPEHFGVVAGTFDTPWLRDHAPVFVREGAKTAQVLPRRFNTQRAKDLNLFATILPGAQCMTDLIVAGGNLVAGDRGLAVSTLRLLLENRLRDTTPLRGTAEQLGIRDWILVPPMPDDPSAHADSMVRFLGPDLVAVCRRLDTAAATAASVATVEQIMLVRPDIRILELPVAANEAGFNSPMNWIQLGQTLLVPEFGQPDAIAEIRADRLAGAGFKQVPIPCETAGLGGALHCLTASIFAG